MCLTGEGHQGSTTVVLPDANDGDLTDQHAENQTPCVVYIHYLPCATKNWQHMFAQHSSIAVHPRCANMWRTVVLGYTNLQEKGGGVVGEVVGRLQPGARGEVQLGHLQSLRGVRCGRRRDARLTTTPKEEESRVGFQLYSTEEKQRRRRENSRLARISDQLPKRILEALTSAVPHRPKSAVERTNHALASYVRRTAKAGKKTA